MLDGGIYAGEGRVPAGAAPAAPAPPRRAKRSLSLLLPSCRGWAAAWPVLAPRRLQARFAGRPNIGARTRTLACPEVSYRIARMSMISQPCKYNICCVKSDPHSAGVGSAGLISGSSVGGAGAGAGSCGTGSGSVSITCNGNTGLRSVPALRLPGSGIPRIILRRSRSVSRIFETLSRASTLSTGFVIASQSRQSRIEARSSWSMCESSSPGFRARDTASLRSERREWLCMDL